MKNDSAMIFRANLERLSNESGYETTKEMSDRLDIPIGTLKCWLSGNRKPRLTGLEKVANKLGCHVSNLLKPNGDLTDSGIHSNNIHRAFTAQLRRNFIKYKANTLPGQYFLLDPAVSEDGLKSYLRKKNYRLPSLSKLDSIADKLNIPTYEIIEEVGSNEKTVKPEE